MVDPRSTPQRSAMPSTSRRPCPPPVRPGSRISGSGPGPPLSRTAKRSTPSGRLITSSTGPSPPYLTALVISSEISSTASSARASPSAASAAARRTCARAARGASTVRSSTTTVGGGVGRGAVTVDKQPCDGRTTRRFPGANGPRGRRGHPHTGGRAAARRGPRPAGGAPAVRGHGDGSRSSPWPTRRRTETPAARPSVERRESRREPRHRDAAGMSRMTPTPRRWAPALALAALLALPAAAAADPMPVTEITSHPAALTRDPLPDFTFGAVEGGGVQCALDPPDADALDFVVCPDPGVALPEGPHELFARAYVKSGGETYHGEIVHWAWRIDHTPPQTTIDNLGELSAATTGRAITLRFSGLDATHVTHQCRLDAAAFGPCPGATPGTASYTGLSVARHTFQVRSVDGVGLVDLSPAQFTWTVTAPHTTTSPPPPVVVTPPAVTPPVARTAPRIRPTAKWSVRGGRTRYAKLVLAGVPARSKVTVRCAGKGCRFAKRSVRPASGRADLTRLVRGLRLGRGAVLTIRTAAPGRLVVVTRIRIARTGPR